jgi:hypothetical protein
MRRTRRLPKRLVRLTSLCACLTLVLTSLVTVPAHLVSGKGSIDATQDQNNQQTNGNARKVKAEPPQKGPPSATLPNLDEVRRSPRVNPETPFPVSSSSRSRRKPLQPRNGKKVGDPGTTGSSIGANRMPVSTQTVSRRLHHARGKAITIAPTPLGDDQFVQNFVYWALLRNPYSNEQTYWTDIVRSAYPQGQTSMLIAMREFGRTIFESAAYAARPYRDCSNSTSSHNYVYDLYKSYLMRDPDQGGWDFWAGQCQSYGQSQVRAAFDESGEFSNLVASLTPNGSASSAVGSLSSARVDPFNQTGDQLEARDCEWSLPLLSLPGRAGLDLGLGLSYSSLVWTRSGSYLYFDEDYGSPSPGFHLGFATVQSLAFDAQASRNVYVLVTSSGHRVELRQVGSSNVYEAADSSYLQLVDNGSSLLVRSIDGTQISYSAYANGWRATQVKDRNGNYLTISNDWRGDIQNITDTLGRVIYLTTTAT